MTYCITLVPGAYKDQIMDLDTLNLGLQTVLNHCWDPEKEIKYSERLANAFKG